MYVKMTHKYGAVHETSGFHSGQKAQDTKISGSNRTVELEMSQSWLRCSKILFTSSGATSGARGPLSVSPCPGCSSIGLFQSWQMHWIISHIQRGKGLVENVWANHISLLLVEQLVAKMKPCLWSHPSFLLKRS